MEQDELLKDILHDPAKYYNKQELKLLSIQLKRGNQKGTINNFFKKKIEYESDRIYVFTDGSCINNGKKNAKGGFGVFFGKNDMRNISKKFKKGETVSNNKAELTAILECLKVLTPMNKYYIVSDSEYSINCITKWYKSWILNGWKTSTGKDVKNKDIIQKILKELKNLDIKFLHIESHKNPPKDRTTVQYKLWYGNYMADRLSVQASNNQ